MIGQKTDKQRLQLYISELSSDKKKQTNRDYNFIYKSYDQTKKQTNKDYNFMYI